MFISLIHIKLNVHLQSAYTEKLTHELILTYDSKTDIGSRQTLEDVTWSLGNSDQHSSLFSDRYDVT